VESSEGQQLMEAFDRLASALDGKFRSGNNSSIRVDAGGAAVWMATTACLVMLGMMFMGGLWASYAFQQAAAERAALRESQETQQAYLNVLLQNAKPQEPK